MEIMNIRREQNIEKCLIKVIKEVTKRKGGKDISKGGKLILKEIKKIMVCRRMIIM